MKSEDLGHLSLIHYELMKDQVFFCRHVDHLWNLSVETLTTPVIELIVVKLAAMY